MDSAGNTANLNVFAPDGLIARKEGSSWTYYTFDAQGSVVHKLDANNNPTAGRLLDAWGTGVETTLPRNIDPWGYNAKWGYYYDRETALYYCQNRMYDASTGRWLNRDPIGAAGGVNVYGYCGNGANGSADPSGLLPVETVLDAAGLGADIAEFAAAPSWAGFGYMSWSAAALLIPYVPGSWVRRGVQGAKRLLGMGGKADDAVEAVVKRMDCEPAGAGTGKQAKGKRTKNELNPDTAAEGRAHSTFDRREKDGVVYKYETYEPPSNPFDPASLRPTKRFDGGLPDGGPGKPHNGVPTPHINFPRGGPDARPPYPSELPLGFN